MFCVVVSTVVGVELYTYGSQTSIYVMFVVAILFCSFWVRDPKNLGFKGFVKNGLCYMFFIALSKFDTLGEGDAFMIHEVVMWKWRLLLLLLVTLCSLFFASNFVFQTQDSFANNSIYWVCDA